MHRGGHKIGHGRGGFGFRFCGANWPLQFSRDVATVWDRRKARATEHEASFRWIASCHACGSACERANERFLRTSGSVPNVLAFDGTYLWVVNSNNTVTKFSPSTGVTVGTYPTGSDPIGITFDGTNIWTANSGSKNLTKLLASTGTLVDTYPVGIIPNSIAFDGTNIWVSEVQNGIAFDGTNIWATNGGSVTKLLGSTGTIVGTYRTSAGGNSANGVTKLLASTGAIVGTYSTGSTFPRASSSTVPISG